MHFEKDFDILVAGAGVAGVAAALECVRAGLYTALVEKTVLVGGLATTGLVNIYLPLCDGSGHQVTYGIAEELLHLSIKYGPGDVPDGWREGRGRYLTTFSPASFVLALDEVLEDVGVALWLDTLFCRPAMDGERIVGLEVENKSGCGVLRARCVIDATGDADVAYRAGAVCAESDNWLSMWAIQASYAKAQQVVAQPDKTSLLDCVRLGADAWGHGISPDALKFYGTDGAQVTRFIVESRRLLREHYRAKQVAGGDTDRHKLFPVTLPAMAQFRTTRRIVGQATLTDSQDGVPVPTSVGLVPDWRKPGPVWEIPYEVLLPCGVAGLLVAGRCISSEGDAWEVTRVIPPAALTGQIAGIAARLAISGNTTPDALDVRDVQRELARYHIPFHIGDVR
ncbi:MAG: FAD-dependent oxidoreductase [Anaerolineae bacterium]|nr:FAD-dependent oxidoreductase [Anaerolineae bacterium]